MLTPFLGDFDSMCDESVPLLADLWLSQLQRQRGPGAAAAGDEGPEARSPQAEGSEQISGLGCCAVALWGGEGVACPSGEVTSLHSVHSSSHRSLSPSTLLNCIFLALNLKGKLICTQSMQSLLSRELTYLKAALIKNSSVWLAEAAPVLSPSPGWEHLSCVQVEFCRSQL